MSSPPKDNDSDPRPGAGGIFVRALLPIALIAAGWFGYSKLANEPEEAKAPEKETRALKTRVAELTIEDFPTVVTTQGTVRSHEEVPLSAQVPGEIVRIHPGFEDGAFFNEKEVLVELDAADFKSAVAVADAEVVRAESALAQEEARAEQAVLNWRKLGKTGQPSDLVQRLPQLKEARANVDAAKAESARAGRDLERTKIRAPFDGRVRERTVGLGQTIAAGTPLGTVFAVDYAEVRLPLAGRDLALLDLPEDADDPKVEVELSDGLNLENPMTWKAEIVRTEGVLDPDSLELFAIARISDPFGRRSGSPPLRIGQPVVAQIEGRILEKVIVLPRSAVYQLDQIYLVDREKLTLASHTITALWSTEQHIIVRDPEIDINRNVLALTSLIYAPEGATVEILPSLEADEPSDEDPDLTLESETGTTAKKADDTSS